MSDDNLADRARQLDHLTMTALWEDNARLTAQSQALDDEILQLKIQRTALQNHITVMTLRHAADTALLREAEWAGEEPRSTPMGADHDGWCLWCGRLPDDGHAPDCRLRAALEGRNG